MIYTDGIGGNPTSHGAPASAGVSVLMIFFFKLKSFNHLPFATSHKYLTVRKSLRNKGHDTALCRLLLMFLREGGKRSTYNEIDASLGETLVWINHLFCLKGNGYEAS